VLKLLAAAGRLAAGGSKLSCTCGLDLDSGCWPQRPQGVKSLHSVQQQWAADAEWDA